MIDIELASEQRDQSNGFAKSDQESSVPENQLVAPGDVITR